ncbi:MAG: hypothetical protein NC453_24295 [Muribaculum sp.]|nr:hypothetical protein [Muribaculum sp.]
MIHKKTFLLISLTVLSLYNQLLAEKNVIQEKVIPTYKAVGKIHYTSEVSPSGAQLYDVPLMIPLGVGNMTPSISIHYNSQDSEQSICGAGWSLSGVSAITREKSNLYFNGNCASIKWNNSDAFSLDNNRLCLYDQKEDMNFYETFTGNIKVVSHSKGDLTSYFEVFYPNGEKAVFGYKNNIYNRLEYPITQRTDQFGNTIEYMWIGNNIQMELSEVRYNGVKINFTYNSDYMDSSSLIKYIGGIAIANRNTLKEITITREGTQIGVYSFKYNLLNNKKMLAELGYHIGSHTQLNPLKFSYGLIGQHEYSMSEGTFTTYFENSKNNSLRMILGHYDPSSSTEGIAVMNNFSSYYHYHQNSTFWYHSRDPF